MFDVVSRFKVVPLFDGGQQNVHYIGINDLCKFIHKVCVNNCGYINQTYVYNVFHHKPVKIKELINFFCKISHVRCIYINININTMIFILSIIERYFAITTIKSNNLKGLVLNNDINLKTNVFDILHDIDDYKLLISNY